MTRPADSLRAVMLADLRRSRGIGSAMSGRIHTTETAELPSAWVGVTESIDSAPAKIELLATVHVLEGTEEGASNTLRDVHSMFIVPPTVDGYIATSWVPGHSEVRLDDEQSAYRGLARFHIFLRPT